MDTVSSSLKLGSMNKSRMLIVFLRHIEPGKAILFSVNISGCDEYLNIYILPDLDSDPTGE